MKLNLDWKFEETFPSISAYTTSYDCIKGKYPFEEAIKSFSWADQVVVVDGGSTDGTRERLEELTKELPNLEIYDIPLEEDNPGKDGQLKAMARAMTSGEFCLQFDIDELCRGDVLKWKRLAKNFPKNEVMNEIFVYEPIGSLENLRLNASHNPLKWRISRNLPEISHGIPDYDRLERDDKVYSKGGSDGCFPINIVDNRLIRSFVPSAYQEVAKIKREINQNEDNEALSTPFILQYKTTVQKLIQEEEPYILHLGHVDLKNKIKLYLSSWKYWWSDLYGKDVQDPANNVYFPNIPFEQITEEMIDERVREIVQETLSVKIEGV